MNKATEIILIEDNISDADLIKRVFSKNKLINTVIHLNDGQEALDYFEKQLTNQNSFLLTIPVILLDLKMPKISGLVVLEKIKSNERTKKIPVVILTSSKEDPDIAESYRLGANSYVVKPMVYNEFVKAVTELGQYWLMVNQPLK
ncbi:MAG: response regulator [Sediminibacterium sp.]|nr:response regulator [Sediminibacterium sp.]